ncbi:MAG: CDGSH iron-sulfur domain-containing protein [Rhodospirillales bacterium]|nr:CDGSH iron-sulfur domain-containing protein [Rhodospirillales bacterium]
MSSGWRDFPFKIEVSAGDKKAFCMCGLSKNGPFCDGSHKATDVTPEVIAFDEDQTLFVCGCRQSAKRPFCDGTHRTLQASDADSDSAHWHKVVERGVLGERQPRVAAAGGRSLALFRVDGGYFALANDCPQDGGSLGEGRVDAEGYLCCPRHGRGFRPADGKGTHEADVETFPIEVRKDGVYVLVEAAADAKPRSRT